MLKQKNGKRRKALKHREKHITREEIEKRDEVLKVDYNQQNYDLVLVNDHREETIKKAINKIQKELQLETARTKFR